jgi:hypothetical protein
MTADRTGSVRRRSAADVPAGRIVTMSNEHQDIFIYSLRNTTALPLPGWARQTP